MAAHRQATLLFEEQSSSSPACVGGKGAGLAAMVALGLPVPPGFTIHTGVCRAYLQHSRLPRRLAWQVTRSLAKLEQETGREFGDSVDPLLVSVRSGAAVSMPGMMDTVLNLGINPEVVSALSRRYGEWFAYDTFRRFLAMYGEVVMGVDAGLLKLPHELAKLDAGGNAVSADALEIVCVEMLELIEMETGSPVPVDPREQLDNAITAVFRSWNSERAIAYRQAHGLNHAAGTAVNVQAMVYGNRDEASASGVVFSSNPTTGQPGLFGEFLVQAQGEDVVAGASKPLPISHLADWNQQISTELAAHVSHLATLHGEVVDVEFTVESGRLYILQVRAAKQTLVARVTQAVHRVWSGEIAREDAVSLFTADEFMQLKVACVDKDTLKDVLVVLGNGIAVSPGAATGVVVDSSADACELAATGQSVVLVRCETSPDDLPGMLVASAIVTFAGGTTCHAAVVAREIGRPCVVNAQLHRRLRPGMAVTVDGTSGSIYRGRLPLTNARPTKEVAILMKWKQGTAYQPRLNFDLMKEHHSVNRMATDFYSVDAMWQCSRGTALEDLCYQKRQKVHIDAAEFLATYVAVAVAGELRHYARSNDNVDLEAHPHISHLRQKFGLVAVSECLGDERAHKRQDVQEKIASALRTMDVASQIEFFETAALAFKSRLFGGSYGGEMWAQIARAGAMFLRGEMPPTVAADHIFDLRHNCGRIFDKHPMASDLTHEGDLGHQLDYKRSVPDINELWSKLNFYGRASDQITELWHHGQSSDLW
jgi:phosphohistidine swiveling domain-containing protein